MAKKPSSSVRRRELVIFGQRLRSWRKAKKWSQEKLALAAGLDFSYVNEIENGKLNPGVVTVLALSRALEISPAFLFLPVQEAQRLQHSPAIQQTTQEERLSAYLEQPELLESHCQLVVQYARQGQWEGAMQWLKALQQWFPTHGKLAYTAARYHCERAQSYLPQPEKRATGLAVAEASVPYPLHTTELTQELEQALTHLREAVKTPEVVRQLPHEESFRILQQYYPTEWQALFQS